MTRAPHNGSQDLAADLIADMTRDDVKPRVVTRLPKRPVRATGPVAYTVSSKMQITPSSWQRPSLGFLPDGVVAAVGPVRFEVAFR